MLEVVERGHNVFITGQAGTGKSFLVKEIFRSLSRKGTKWEGHLFQWDMQEQFMEISPRQCPQSILFMVCKPQICRNIQTGDRWSMHSLRIGIPADIMKKGVFSPFK